MSHIKNSTKSVGYFNNNGGNFTLWNIWHSLDLHCDRVNSVVILLKPQNKDAHQWHIQRCLLHPCIPPAPIPVGPWQSPSPWQYVIPDPISISSTWETASSLRWWGPRERSICRKEGPAEDPTAVHRQTWKWWCKTTIKSERKHGADSSIQYLTTTFS